MRGDKRKNRYLTGRGKRSRPPRPGPSGPLYAESLPPAAFPGASSPLALRQRSSTSGLRRANRLVNNNKQFAPVTWKSQRELPGIRKTEGQPENEFIHFLVCPAVFRCAPCSTARQRSWLPGSGGLRYPSNSGKLLVIEAKQHPPLPGSGVGLPPQWGMGAWSARKMILWIIFSGKRAGRPRKSPIGTPSNFCFCVAF